MTDASVACALECAMKDVLERMFFLDAVNASAGARHPGPTLDARLRFQGAPSGLLFLSVPLDAARVIACDFLGLEPGGLSDAQLGEVVCEMANMICGSVLSRVEGSAGFRLQSPEIVSGANAACAVAAGAELENGLRKTVASHSVEAESCLLTATLITEPFPCPPTAKPAY